MHLALCLKCLSHVICSRSTSLEALIFCLHAWASTRGYGCSQHQQYDIYCRSDQGCSYEWLNIYLAFILVYGVNNLDGCLAHFSAFGCACCMHRSRNNDRVNHILGRFIYFQTFSVHVYLLILADSKKWTNGPREPISATNMGQSTGSGQNLMFYLLF